MMYMHTLDKKPALVERDSNGTWIGYAGGRAKAKLAASLRQIRREQAAAMATAARFQHMTDPAFTVREPIAGEFA